MNANGLTDGKSTLVQVMAWCRQAASHYLSQCWPRSLSPYGISRPQWVNWHNLPMIWIWISNYMYCFVWDVIIHPCPNFDRTAVGDRAWTSNYIPLFKLWRVDSPPTHTHTQTHTNMQKAFPCHTSISLVFTVFEILLCLWISGCAGFVVNDQRQVLVVKEKYSAGKPRWKLPGGMADKGSLDRPVRAWWHHIATEIWVNFDSGCGLLPDGTKSKPLPEPMLTYHNQGSVTFVWGWFHKEIAHPSIS